MARLRIQFVKKSNKRRTQFTVLGFEEEPNTFLSSFIVMNTGVIQQGGGGGGGTIEAAPRRTKVCFRVQHGSERIFRVREKSCDWSSADDQTSEPLVLLTGSPPDPERNQRRPETSIRSTQRPSVQIHLKTLRSDPPEDPPFTST
ncbi:putative chitinase 10 [Dissostichus eleginoides]|uniref:Chitinase 10 n=1 Tax=Dissostichus eleginoides TaxID=100907 RepID=A0AAD9ER95_DISEL|nr:putative chitinase 10 [Dissostichus eleginoides]